MIPYIISPSDPLLLASITKISGRFTNGKINFTWKFLGFMGVIVFDS
jgi:hypothetical protein